MKKTIKKIVITIAIIALVLVITIVGTNSKYLTKVTGNGKVDVAKWSFKVNDNSRSIETIKLSETYDEETLVNGKIAPGTQGSFDLNIDATGSEVGVEYSVDFTNENNKPTNLIFKCGDKTFSSIEGFEEYFTGVINANDQVKTKTLTVNWQWPYETGTDADTIATNDETDTNEGIANLDYTFDVVVTGTQVLPNK